MTARGGKGAGVHRLVSALGTALVIGGAALLVYVGYVSMHTASAHVPSWSAAQKRSGAHIARKYAGSQKVAIPSRLASAGLPVRGREPAIRMVIPAINLRSPVFQTAPVNGVWEVADWAVGHLSTTPNPGAPGNGAYSAHDDIKGEVFKRLGELKPGDQINLYTHHAVYTYAVTTQLVVDPGNISVLSPTRNSTITLISCTPYWVDTQRLIIHAVLKSVSSV
jgi:LPXTG-site transpeptidase (sortase) family protein